jgi:hypothetical protein
VKLPLKVTVDVEDLTVVLDLLGKPLTASASMVGALAAADRLRAAIGARQIQCPACGAALVAEAGGRLPDHGGDETMHCPASGWAFTGGSRM